MSLITRCPICQTMFKVVPDQLRISEGWVRCGQCSEVFDASAHLHENALAEDATPTPEPTPAPVPTPVIAVSPTLGPVPTEPEAAPPTSGLNEEPDPSDSEIRANAEQRFDDALEDARALTPVVDANPDASKGHAQKKIETQTPAEVPAEQLSFVRNANAKYLWTRPWVRAGLSLIALLLCLGLALQVLLLERDRIVALAPQLQPLIEEVCLPLRCSLAPRQQIDAIVLESSSFNKVGGEVYRLNFTLKNKADIALAVPAIELSLTDAQDQAVLRRVLLATELGLPTVLLPAAREISVSLPLGVKSNGASERIAGYRILAFYP